MTAVVSSNATIKKSVPQMTPSYYRELIDKASSYNAHLSADRRLRMPYIDCQTGVAQNHSSIWHPYRARGPGEHIGQIYSYPGKRWKKKKRSMPLPELRLTKLPEVETEYTDMHQISAVENPVVAPIKEDVQPQYTEEYPYHYYDEWDMEEPLDAGEIDTRHTDSSDFEDTYIKKKKRKKTGSGRFVQNSVIITPKHKGGRGRKKDMVDRDDSDKPFSCEQCGARYKTRPGLSYHVNHSHSNAKKKEPGHYRDHSSRDQSHERDQSRSSTEFSQTVGYDEEAPNSPHLDDSFNGKTRSTVRSSPVVTREAVSSTGNSQSEVSKYCDFCLGDAAENKKTGTKEELVSCADCGRSGHPSCLQFTVNMIISVKKYPWQCIECKSCGLCGTSDNDDQLLFCDDCDRGYHMYCLKPPLSEPPEGSWSCHLCIDEFYGGKKPDNGQADTVSL